uniref:Sodium-coupled neutral amino acid transporter 7 n=1 Tax=Hirondellea gigas TaxID=1518452 RepID=A0A6A7G3S9_9CRUS
MFDKNEFARMFDVLPTISFGYQCHVSSVPIYYSIANRNRKKYFKACALAMICCAVVYSVAANFGYLTFGSKVADDILLSYDNEHTGAMAVNIAVIALAFKSVTTYPVLMFCVREAVVSFYVSARGMTPAEIVITEPRRRYVVVLLLWLTSIAAAIVATNISVVVRLLGSLAAFFIFLIPGICLFVHCNELDELEQNGSSGSHHSKVKLNLVRVASITYILLGVFTFGLSVTLAAQSILYPSSEDFGPLCVVGENNTSFFLHLQSAASSSHHHLSLLHASYQK